MTTKEWKCSGCGRPLEVDLTGPWEGAELAAPLCRACTDLLFIREGGAVLTFRQSLEGARFPVGKVTITPGALQALAEAHQHAVLFLRRHVQGDWGEYGHADQTELTEDELRRGWEATDDSGKLNKINLLHGQDTLMSEYRTSRGTRLWIITWLDRSGETTVLLPSEY